MAIEQKKLIGNIGYKGERGYSAYEIAVKNGFVGTEEEWLEQIISSTYNAIEYINNKTTAINSSSTDIQYPSAKAVNDKILSEISSEISSLNQQINNLLGNKQNTILSGTTEPLNSLGVDGDIYLQYN